MKSCRCLTPILFSLLFVLSCSYEHKYNKEKDAFVGSWNVVENFNAFCDNGEVYVSNECQYDLVLNADGTGYENNTNGDKRYCFNWHYQVNPRQIVFIEEDDFGLISESFTYNIEEVNKSSMVWNSQYTFINGNFETKHAEEIRTFTKL